MSTHGPGDRAPATQAGPRLENRLVPDDDHGRREHPLRELAWLLGATLAAGALAFVLLGWAAQWLAPRVPFAAEQALAERLMPERPPASPEDQARRIALQALADRVASVMALPAGMGVQVGDEPQPDFNAYATVGGRIRVFHGVLAQVAHEEELAALLAHEMAHVQHRHVAANLGRGLAVALLLSVVSSDAGAAVAQGLLGQAAQLALLGYSREQERQADEAALHASAALYGHVGGALALMRRLAELEQQRGRADGPVWWRSHPHGQDRVTAALQLAQARGWALQGDSRPLPQALRPSASPPQKKWSPP